MTQDIDSAVRDRRENEYRRSLEDIWFEKAGGARKLGLNVNWIEPSDGGPNEILIVGSDITEKKRAEDELRFKIAFLEAQMQATIDGILVVDENAKILFHNRRFMEIFEIPQTLWNNRSDEPLLQHVLGKIENSEGFLQRVKYLYTHRQDTSRDEIKFLDGTVLDRYSSPVFGRDGHYYGRIWSFRDITARKRPIFG